MVIDEMKLKAALTALAVVVLAAAVLVPVAGASGMMGTPSPSPSSAMMPTPPPSPTPGTTRRAGWCGGGIWNGTGTWGGTGMWGTGSGMAWLTSNPDALAAWLQLRTDHQQAMQTWYDTYKADLTTPEAQQALHDLWTSELERHEGVLRAVRQRRHLDLPRPTACGAAGTWAA